MTQFDATLIVQDDPTPLPTTVELNEGNLVVTSGEVPIGTWSLDQVELSRVLGGFAFEADGETVTLKIPKADLFADALDSQNGSGPSAKQKRSKARKVAKTPKAEVVSDAKAVAKKTTPAKAAGEVTPLDQKLEAAQNRFGKHLPDWFFTRGGLVVLGVSLVVLIIFRQIFSAIFLIAAAVGLTASAVALVDQVIAVRIFRGRITAIQGLIVSLSIGLVGLLIGWRL